VHRQSATRAVGATNCARQVCKAEQAQDPTKQKRRAIHPPRPVGNQAGVSAYCPASQSAIICHLASLPVSSLVNGLKRFMKRNTSGGRSHQDVAATCDDGTESPKPPPAAFAGLLVVMARRKRRRWCVACRAHQPVSECGRVCVSACRRPFGVPVSQQSGSFFADEERHQANEDYLPS